ncbi:myotubularin-related protein 3-like isoform X3 [Leptotrombidium deliense]|uniref:Myotubularin-related protein 3-like isoform X3 n=1 Tax=Leptotrombidium deliense TaxID=299467 RepID=A0A443ST69_9ACAR|nr:myotubularin-related protein 3-like isoform X3 [Leptotrombidium deliense]
MLDESKPVCEGVAIMNNSQMPTVCNRSFVQCCKPETFADGFAMEEVSSSMICEPGVFERTIDYSIDCLVSTEIIDPLSASFNGIKFPKLKGELMNYKGATTEGIIILTNYRIFLCYNNILINPVSMPVGAIETAEVRDLVYLHIHTKLARSLTCCFPNAEECSTWLTRITDALVRNAKLDNLFCFKYFKALLAANDEEMRFLRYSQSLSKGVTDVKEESSLLTSKEFKRMSFDSGWRISEVNKDFKLCPSYPRYLIVPKNITDKDLEEVSAFRYSHRVPTVVWRHRKNGCVISRSSQPEVGWLGWRNSWDENLLQSIVSSCYGGDQSSKKLLIVDARSYAAAVANRAKGGGCECQEYYPCCDVQFMSLANIHTIRKSFNTLRYICDAAADQLNWLTLLDNSKWLNHISSLIKSASVVVNAIHDEGRPVLVHCSDGWDRTPQIVALSELMLDPFYRTIDGFRILVEREWCSFGHKFAERCGNSPNSDDVNERCPVFLQWLDCVHQLVRQNPCSFEFNLQYLVLRSSFKIKHMFFWSDVYGPLASHSVVHPTATSSVHCLSSSSNNCDSKKNVNDFKANDSDTNTNETESDLETVSSEKHSNLVKTQSCDNVNCVEDTVTTAEMCSRMRHHSESDLNRSLCIINQNEENEVRLDSMKSIDVLNFKQESDYCRINCLSVADIPSKEINPEIVTVEESSDPKSVQKCSDCEKSLPMKPIIGSGKDANVDCEENNRVDPCEPYCDTYLSNTPEVNGSNSFNFSDNAQCFSNQVCTKKSFGIRHSSEHYCDEIQDVNPTNGKHTRTPSSGCPATPNDDQCSDISASKSGFDSAIHQMFDIDGQVVVIDEIQMRLRQLMQQHKAEVDSLRNDLYMVRLTLCQQVNYCGSSWRTGKGNANDVNRKDKNFHSLAYFLEFYCRD